MNVNVSLDIKNFCIMVKDNSNNEFSLYLMNMYKTLTNEEQILVSLVSIVCKDGLSKDVLCNIIMPDYPSDFNLLINNLTAQDWMYCDGFTIHYNNLIAPNVLNSVALDGNTCVEILERIKIYIDASHLDDLYPKRDYYLAARLIINYIMDKWESLSIHPKLEYIFSNVAVAFCKNIELSFFGNRRHRVNILEERFDFSLLSFVSTLSDSGKEVQMLLGSICVKNFKYDRANLYFQKAKLILESNNGCLLFELANYYEQLSQYHKAIQFAYSAFQNSYGDNKIKFALYLSYLFAIIDSLSDSKIWRNLALQLIGKKDVPFYSEANIILLKIEALLHRNDPYLAHQILDNADLLIIKLYGDYAPDLSSISAIRFIIDDNSGKLRKSNIHYLNYCKLNHYNFGLSCADTAVLYSSIINDNIIRGNIISAHIYADYMHNLSAENDKYSPGVRLSQALANAVLCLSDENFKLCESYLESLNLICEKELIPDSVTQAELDKIFSNGLSESIKMIPILRTIKILSVSNLLGQGQVEKAKEIIELAKNSEENIVEKLKWDIELGRTFIYEGKKKEGVDLWRSTIERSTCESKFEISIRIAELANNLNMIFESKGFYEEALNFEIMAYEKKNFEIAKALQGYAQVLNCCGINDGSEDSFKQAELLFRSIEDKDGLAYLYLSWASTKNAIEAESLIKKAIKNWEPEGNIFDETLSTMYHHLACAQSKQGKFDEASHSAHMSINLYPFEYPISLIEEKLQLFNIFYRNKSQN